MKMTTEEAFIKVLQMHGIEHAFGIIGSAMMSISNLFPEAGITFWDGAHECNSGMSADGYTRVTGKMSMAIAQNGSGITNFVTPIKTAYWNHTLLLLVTPQAANKSIEQGGELDVDVDYTKIAQACGVKEIRVQTPEELTNGLKTAIDEQMNDKSTTFIGVILNQELGEPFRRDAMKAPVVVSGIDPSDMKPQQVY